MDCDIALYIGARNKQRKIKSCEIQCANCPELVECLSEISIEVIEQSNLVNRICATDDSVAERLTTNETMNILIREGIIE